MILICKTILYLKICFFFILCVSEFSHPIITNAIIEMNTEIDFFTFLNFYFILMLANGYVYSSVVVVKIRICPI